MRLPNFIGGSYPAQSPTAALERTINFYPEMRSREVNKEDGADRR